MTLRCRPGDLAILVKSELGINLGKFCTVESACDSISWFVEFAHAINWCNGHYGRAGVVDDAWLRPIRNPGDEAQDEMLRPLPVPVEDFAHG